MIGGNPSDVLSIILYKSRRAKNKYILLVLSISPSQIKNDKVME